ncbi:MAG: hypothetical protein KDH09_19175, partial [Chrysiogenetes bacterium]|nr:hypothetical protein [Chrysiogenetes bacterium]
DVNLNVIARGTPGFAGADLENLVNEAALLAARRDRESVSMAEFDAAKDKVMMGTERRSQVISDAEKKTTAYHEAGHTIVGKLLVSADPIHKVTIIPRGMALGLTQYLPAEDKHTYSRSYVESQISILMGGRIAEELIFDELTTGAGNDIERATDLARKMVCEWGMSDKLGPLTYGEAETEVFLGRDMTRSRNYSEDTSQQIDREIRDIVAKNYDRARKLLEENIEILHRMAKYLLERETLDAVEVEAVMRGDTLPAQAPAVTQAPKSDDRSDKGKPESAPSLVPDKVPT